MGINRTFMELKLKTALRTGEVNISINRTFMELKLASEINSLKATRVLIEPLWN